MLRFVIGRIAESVVTVWGIVTIVFVVSRLVGDPAVLLLPIASTEQQMIELREHLGLDRPIIVQYLEFLWRVCQGDFGTSFQSMRPALDVVMERMGATMVLGSSALVLGTLIGMAAGAIAALYRGKMAEVLVMLFALLGQATPIFWLGIMLILIFSVELGLFPTGGYTGVASIVLPAFTLAIFISASIARLFRSSILEVLKEDYVRTARAKGLRSRTVFFWHVARNALIPVVTMLALLAGELLGGSVVTETIFSWPGVGRLIVQAIQSRDFPVVQAGVTVIAIIFVAINLLVDLLYGVLDPRIRAK